MKNHNVFVLILSILSAFSAFGSEKQPSSMERIVKLGCLGICGGPVVYTLTKGYLTKDCPSHVRFSQEDLLPMAISGGIGLGIGVFCGILHNHYNHNRISQQFKLQSNTSKKAITQFYINSDSQINSHKINILETE